MYRSHGSTAIVAKEVELIIESAESGSNFPYSFANRFHEQQDVRLWMEGFCEQGRNLPDWRALAGSDVIETEE
jgi:hypothetical protein